MPDTASLWTEEQQTTFGADTERRFFEAVNKYHADEPHWFLGIAQASIVLDMRGVDYIAYVKYPGRREPVAVPIQVKSSYRRAKSYAEKQPTAVKAGVPVLVIRDRNDAAAIRNKLFEALAKVRMDGTRFDRFLQREGYRPVSKKNGLVHYRRIEAARAKALGIDLTLPPGPMVFLPPPPLTFSERLQEYITSLFGKKSFGSFIVA